MDLSTLVIRLLKGVLYREGDERLWDVLLSLQDPAATYPTMTGACETAKRLYFTRLFGHDLPYIEKAGARYAVVLNQVQPSDHTYVDELIEVVLQTRVGDANLDSVADGSDFNIWNSN